MLTPINKRIKKGYIDGFALQSSGILSIYGWNEDQEKEVDFNVTIDRNPIQSFSFFRTYRPDVSRHLKNDNFYLGFCREYLIENSVEKASLRIRSGWHEVYHQTLDLFVQTPHYAHLLTQDAVLKQHQIYGSGPPVSSLAEEIRSLTPFLSGKILDFGCGQGNLVRYCRELGLNAWGIEMNRLDIANHIPTEISPFIKLYDGSIPLPYADEEFDCVTAIEVLEHIPDLESAVHELRRICTNRLILTVPDSSALPRCFPIQMIPWHFLEMSHCNFFTSRSLSALMQRYFRKVSIFKFMPRQIESIHFENNLGAVCREPL